MTEMQTRPFDTADISPDASQLIEPPRVDFSAAPPAKQSKFSTAEAELFDGDNPVELLLDKPAEDRRTEVKQLGGTRAPAKSDSEAFRTKLEAAGIDPDNTGTAIGLYEPLDREDKRQEHPEMVGDVIDDLDTGLSRDADVRTFSPLETTPEVRLSDFTGSDNPIADFMTEYSKAAMGDLTRFIKENLLGQDEMRVLNVSQAFSPMFAHRQIKGEIEKNPEAYGDLIRDLMGEENGNRWIERQLEVNEERRRLMAGEIQSSNARNDPDLGKALDQALMDQITESLKNNPEFDAAMEEYRDVTRKAAEEGKFIVVAVANDGMSERFLGIDVPEGAEYNWYAMSDHVIAVGGSDNNGTPFDRTDDTIYNATSEGTDRYHPDVLAQGANVPNDDALGGRIQGTSFAAPLVSATIALMLEQNPELSLAQVKQILRDNATPLDGVPRTIQGDGIIETDLAVIAARESLDG